MPTAVPAPPTRGPSRGLLPGPAVLGGVTWDDYIRFGDDPANEGVRLTYDEPSGRLEIGMPVGRRHDNLSRLLCVLVIAYGRRRRVGITPVGSTTWRRRGAGGAAGDEAFHIGRDGRTLGLDGNVPDLDAGDIPPDLVIEVDVTSPGVAKLPIYAGIGVPEVWVWDEGEIVVHRLADGGYEVVPESVALPGFPLEVAAELIASRAGAPTFELEEAFEAALRAAE